MNFKDGLAVTNTGKIARSFPMICGIDLAGTVTASQDPAWSVGDEVVVTGWGLSESHPGGYTQRQRLKGEWLSRRDPEMSAVQAMAVGTAGLTAMLCVLALERSGLRPDQDGEVLVTGAAGGVGSVAVSILAQRGYQVVASTGRPGEHERLRALGAHGFIDRAELSLVPSRPLEKERWLAAVDTVGSTILASVIRQLRYGGSVSCCGLAGGSDLPVTVLPFILRGVNLLGIDSVQAPPALRAEAWLELRTSLPADQLETITTVEPLSRAIELGADIIAGKVAGRVVFDINS